eukprot:4584187-Amphidinium_carterae.1
MQQLTRVELRAAFHAQFHKSLCQGVLTKCGELDRYVEPMAAVFSPRRGGSIQVFHQCDDGGCFDDTE